MRILPLVVVAVALGVCLTGCVAQQPLAVAGGMTFCLEDPDSGPVALAIDTKNTGTTAISIDAVTASGANITPGKAWLLPAHTKEANGIGGLVEPFAADPDWVQRQVIGRETLKPGQTIAVVATARIPFGGTSAASIQGVDIAYTTADGSRHLAHSNVKAHFRSHC